MSIRYNHGISVVYTYLISSRMLSKIDLTGWLVLRQNYFLIVLFEKGLISLRNVTVSTSHHVALDRIVVQILR